MRDNDNESVHSMDMETSVLPQKPRCRSAATERFVTQHVLPFLAYRWGNYDIRYHDERALLRVFEHMLLTPEEDDFNPDKQLAVDDAWLYESSNGRLRWTISPSKTPAHPSR